MTESMHIINALGLHTPTVAAYRLELSPFGVCVWTDYGVRFTADADRVTIFQSGPDWSEAVA